MELYFIDNLFTQILIASPLDQFGDDDENIISIFNYSILDSISNAIYFDEIVDLLFFNEMDSLSDWISLALSNAGPFLFDD
jgi:hypothetical protein